MARGRGRKKASGTQAVLQWDWDCQRDKVARSLAAVADIDLWKLYRPKPIEESLLQTCSRTASPPLCSPCCLTGILCCAQRYQDCHVCGT